MFAVSTSTKSPKLTETVTVGSFSTKHPLTKDTLVALPERELGLLEDLVTVAGGISDENLQRMMKVDSPLAEFALDYYLGRVGVNGEYRRVAFTDITNELPSLIIKYPHLRDRGADRFYAEYCYGLDLQKPVAEGRQYIDWFDKCPRANISARFISNCPDPSSVSGKALIEKAFNVLVEYRSLTYLSGLLEHELLGRQTAEKILEFPYDPYRLQQEYTVLGKLKDMFPDQAKLCDQRLSLLFDEAIKTNVFPGNKFVKKVLLEDTKYQAKAFEIVKASGNDGLLRMLVKRYPDHPNHLEAADLLLNQGSEDLSKKSPTKMGGVITVLKYEPTRQMTAWNILKDNGSWAQLALCMELDAKLIPKVLQVLKSRVAAKRAASVKFEQGSFVTDPLMSREEKVSFLHSMRLLVERGDDAAEVNKISEFLLDIIADENIVGSYQRRDEKTALTAIVVNPNVINDNRKLAWSKLQELGELGANHLIDVIDKADVAYAHKAFDLLRANIGSLNLNKTALKTIVEAALRTDYSSAAVFAKEFLKNTHVLYEINWVDSKFPDLASEVEEAKKLIPEAVQRRFDEYFELS